MKVFELQILPQRARCIKGYLNAEERLSWKQRCKKSKKKKKQKNTKKILEIQPLCSTCLEQQRIQRKIDEVTHDQRLFDSVVRTLVCEYCQHVEVTIDGDDTNLCTGCGTLQDPDAVRQDIEFNFFVSQKKTHKTSC